MKKYLCFLSIVSMAYGMNSTPDTYSYLSSYLPLEFRGCQYYSYIFIKNNIEEMNKDEYEALKHHALPIAKIINQRMIDSIKTYADKNDPICKAINDLQCSLKKALDDWQHDTSFHPLLFLQHKEKNPSTVVLKEPESTSLPQKPNGHSKHFIKKQKLVQNGR